MPSKNKPFSVIISEELFNIPEDDSDISFSYQPDLWFYPEQLLQYIQEAEGLIVRNQTQVDEELILKANKLQVIGRLGSGLDNIDLAAAHKAGIQVVYAPGANAVSVAEYCLAQILNILRYIPDAMYSTNKGEWLRSEFTGRELSEIIIGLLGYGKIAQALSQRLLFLGGKVIIATRSPEKVPDSIGTVSFNELLESADIVSLHVSGGPESHHLIGLGEFKAMKPTAWLLNTSRGSVVDEKALLAALISGEIAGAILDVRENEPPPPGKLESLPNFLATPHIAAFTHAAQKRVDQGVIADVVAVLRGLDIKNSLFA